MARVTLTKTERALFANQYRILELVDPDHARDYELLRTALERGYELHFADIFDHIWDGLTAEECAEVLEILSMYDALQRSVKQLGDAAPVRPEEVEFPGFDGNNEPAQMGYARYFVNDLDRFSYLKFQNRDINSHMPMLDTYREMLRGWVRTGKSYELKADEIEQILPAWKRGA